MPLFILVTEHHYKRWHRGNAGEDKHCASSPHGQTICTARASCVTLIYRFDPAFLRFRKIEKKGEKKRNRSLGFCPRQVSTSVSFSLSSQEQPVTSILGFLYRPNFAFSIPEPLFSSVIEGELSSSLAFLVVMLNSVVFSFLLTSIIFIS